MFLLIHRNVLYQINLHIRKHVCQVLLLAGKYNNHKNLKNASLKLSSMQMPIYL